ncbi:MAG: HIT domain-containing protein [Verrucomicrobiota bacterium]
MEFTVHPRLAAGGFEIARIGACRVLLKNNAWFPWMIVVPEVLGGDAVEDLHQLPEARYLEVMGVIRKVSEFVSMHFKPEKLNVACIGNQVRQMHVQIVGRSTGDAAWPGVVWSFDGKQTYTAEQVSQIQAAAGRFFV